MRRAAAFPAASSVGVARSPRVGVPSVLRVVSGGRWACAGVIRMASDVCFGGVCWGVWWGWSGVGYPVVVCPSWVWVVVPAVVPFSSVSWSPFPLLPGSWVVSCPHVVSLPAPCPCVCLPSLGALPCPLASVVLGAPCRDAGSNSHEFARMRICPEFARIRGPLRTRIRNFKFESSVIRLIESIGTYNLPSRLQFTCLHMGMPLPSTISHKRFPKSFRNLPIFVVCCCLHLPC